MMTNSDPSRNKNIAVALSGGGHRASLFSLGVLLCLTDAGMNKDVVSISSVSGGSLTNAWLAQQGDYSKLTSRELENQVVRPFVQQVALYGTLWAHWLTWIYIGILCITLLGVFALWCLPVDLLYRSIYFIFGLTFWGFLSTLRGKICAIAFEKILFSQDGFPTLLRDIQNVNIQHIICATDIRAGHHVYFSGDFVCSYLLGWGSPGPLRLADSVQVSSAFPSGFPPRWLSTEQFSFVDGAQKTPDFMVLSDGGIYDNLAEQWPAEVHSRKRRWPNYSDSLKEPDQLVVVDASGPMPWASVRRLRIPLIGEVFPLLRIIKVLYDKTTTTRGKSLFDRFDRASKDAEGLEGVFIMINRSPYWIAEHFAQQTDDWNKRSDRAAHLLRILGDENQDRWNLITEGNRRVKTTLWRLGVDVSTNLLFHGYVSAMANLHVILDFPLIDIPSLDHFKRIVTNDE